MARPVALLLTLLLLAAPACTSEGNDEPAGAATPEASEGTTPGIFAPGDLVLDVAIAEAATLDPMRVQDPGSVLVARQLFEGLTRWDPVEEKILPAAAESWEVEDGGLTFVFHLRPGMTFHDGTQVTSEDFAFAFDRIALKANASDIAYTLDRVKGFVKVNQLGKSAHLAGITTPDELTLQIQLSQPFQDFAAVLTHPGLVPVPRDAVRAVDTFLSQPVGNGPFRIAQPWRPGDEIVLEAYAGFIDTPELDGIRFIPYPDAAASWLRFIEGDLDVVEVPSGQIDAAADAFGDEGYQPFLAGYYYGVNLRSDHLEDLTLRQAISRAIDREAISQTIYKGTLTPARGIVPDGMPGFEENICVPLCSYSEKAARRLVQKLPKSERSVTLEFTRGEPHHRIANAIAADLKAVGLLARTRGFPFSKFLRRLRDGDQSLYRLGWIAEYPSPDVFLTSLFAAGSADNHSGFKSDEVDRLLAKARAERSEGKRTQIYIEAEKAILEKLPVIPIGSFVTHWVAQPGVANIFFDVMGGFDAVGVSLEAD